MGTTAASLFSSFPTHRRPLSPSGWEETVLYRFTGGSDGDVSIVR